MANPLPVNNSILPSHKLQVSEGVWISLPQ